MDYWESRYKSLIENGISGNMRVCGISESDERLYAIIHDIFTKYKSKTQKLVDFGCGIGRLSMAIKLATNADEYIGIDTSKTAIEFAQNECIYSYSVYDGSIPFCDTLSCLFTVQHIMDDDQIVGYFKQFKAAINGGMVLIVNNVSEREDNEYMKFRTIERLEELAREGGLETIDKMPIQHQGEKCCIFVMK